MKKELRGLREYAMGERVEEEAESIGLSPMAGSVEYHLEGQIGQPAGPWNLIERRADLEIVRSDESDYRTWMDESNWHDFRIVKVTTTREILSPNDQMRNQCEQSTSEKP